MIVLIVGTFAIVVLSMTLWWLGYIVAIVVAHFFLFCNVVRMSRPLELIWAGVFVLLASATVAFDTPGWLVTTIVALVTTLVLVIVEMRKPSYHGVGWQRINPGLPAWWEAHKQSN